MTHSGSWAPCRSYFALQENIQLPVLLLLTFSIVNLFVLLSVISVLLNLTGLILACQGIQFVSGVPRCNLMDMDENKICFCCEEHLSKCTEVEALLKLYRVKSCSAAHLLLKKVLLALSALNAVTAAVCLIAAALHYLQIFASRRSCIDESPIEDRDHILDPDDFIPPVPPPSYFATFNSCMPQTSHRTLASDVISLPYIYGKRTKGLEVFCRLDPPPPYEAVCSSNSSEQEPSSRVSLSPSKIGCVPAQVNRRAFEPLRKRSNSDPGLLHWTALYCETATLNDANQLNAVTLRKSSRARALRGRPQSLIDYKSYMDTKQRVAWILEQSPCSMSPDIDDLVENIKSVLKSDEKYMAEAVTSATFLEQAMAPAQQAMSLRVRVLPFRLHPRLLYLESCGDLSTFTTEGEQLAERRIQRAEHERPHSLIGVVRETVL
uniref:Family with sequence similarity 189 member A2 n=1 Tax=Malurus cyaneus samueli TaxID=2593467 RepID=A0A8C5U6F1_9PASS